jgi:signal transduction histidine kinase
MNIGTHTILGNNDHKISVLLSEQMTIARSLIRGLRAVENQTDDLIDLTDHIEEVVDAYHNLWSVKQEGENIEYLDVELKHEEAISISEMILELREEITM